MKWRVYHADMPMNYDGTPYSGERRFWKTNSWFWISKRADVKLYVRVQGLKNARDIAKKLNCFLHEN